MTKKLDPPRTILGTSHDHTETAARSFLRRIAMLPAFAAAFLPSSGGRICSHLWWVRFDRSSGSSRRPGRYRRLVPRLTLRRPSEAAHARNWRRYPFGHKTHQRARLTHGWACVRDKVFGQGRLVPLDRNGKVRIYGLPSPMAAMRARAKMSLAATSSTLLSGSKWTAAMTGSETPSAAAHRSASWLSSIP